MARFERRGFRSFGPRVDIPKPIKVGEEYDVEISEVGARGDGIARIKNFVVFVNDTKKGDKARIKIKEVSDRFAIGEKIGTAKEVTEEATEEEAEEATEEKTEEATEEKTEEVTEEKTEEATEEEPAEEIAAVEEETEEE